MITDLSTEEIDVILMSLEYGKGSIAEAQHNSNDARKQNLARIETVAEKLRAAKKVDRRHSVVS